MALRLILTRHAKSGWGDPLLSDEARPLNARGHADASALGAWLKAQDYTPDQALVSSANRTQETFGLIQGHVKAPDSKKAPREAPFVCYVGMFLVAQNLAEEQFCPL